MIAHNARLITSDNTEIVCDLHNVRRRWGDLDGASQQAVLAGLDIDGDICIMDYPDHG